MNNLFRRQFYAQVFAIFISFALLSVGLTQAFSNFFINQKKEVLTEHSKRILQAFKQAYFFGNGISKRNLEEEINILEQYLDASFIFVNNDGIIKIASSNISYKWYNKKLDIIGNIKKSKDGNYYEIQGNMGGIFNTTMLSIGYPLIINEKEIGIIFINTPVTELLTTVENSYKIIAIFTFISILISFILAYLFSKRISVPFIEINKAAKIMAGGNFQKRIYVNRNDEIGELANILNNMAQSIDEQEKRRREFISNISHDIRSPLTSMKGFLEAIIDGTVPEEKKERYLNIVLEETERLTRLANSIIDINKLEDKDSKNAYVVFDINELIRRGILSFEAIAINKELDITLSFYEEETLVSSDIEKVQRIVYNLIDNAIKFTENGKKIFISTSNAKGNKVYISIKDEGPGISEEDQQRIFDRFYKADYSRGKDKNGSGLGLAIVKEFVISLGETMTINSQINKGTEFVFTLTKVDK